MSPSKVRLSAKIFLGVLIASIILIGSPINAIFDLIEQSNIVDALYLSKLKAGVVDNFGAKTAQAAYTGKVLRTVEYTLGGSTYNPGSALASNTWRYAGAAWTTAKGTDKTIYLKGTGISVKNAYLNFSFNRSGGNTDVSNLLVNLDVTPGPLAGTSVNVAQASSPLYFDGATGDLTGFMRTTHDVTSLFATQSDAQWSAGVGVEAGTYITGPTTTFRTVKLVLTYEADYASTEAVKTVRFPLSASGERGSKAAACAGAATCAFTYTPQLPDAAADADIYDVWFDVTAETNSATASTLQTTIAGGTAGPAFAWVEALTDHHNVNVTYRPPVGGNDFTRSGQKTLNIVNGSVPLQALGGEVVVTYKYATNAATQTDTVRYFVRQDTSATPGAGAINYSQTINISNTGLSVKNVWLKMHAPVTETLNLTVNANINGGTNRAATYALAGANSIRAGAGDVLYHEFSDDVASISGNSFTIGGSTQYSIATGDAPLGIEAYVTFTWSGSLGGAVTKTVAYNVGQQGVSAIAAAYNNAPSYVTLPETVTKTHRSTYLNSFVSHSNGSSITAGTVTLGVNGTTSAYAENAEEGTTVTAESYHRDILHNVTSAVFTGNGGTIGWTNRTFEINANLNQANEVMFSHVFVITYDAALGNDGTAGNSKILRTVEYTLGGSTYNPGAGTASNTWIYSGAGHVSASKSTDKTIYLKGTNIKVRNAYLNVSILRLGVTDTSDAQVTLDVTPGPLAGTSVQVGQLNAPLLIDITTGDLSNMLRTSHDVTALFATQSDVQWSAGVGVEAGTRVTGPTTTLRTIKLIITYEADYASSEAVKTVRFPLSASGERGSKATACAGSTTCAFTYTPQLPDAAADGDIYDVFFDVTAETNSNVASNFQTTIAGGTAGPAFAWVEALVDHHNINATFRPAVGGANFNRSGTQTLNIVNGTVPLQALGGEVVVTYKYATNAATQTDTVRYFVRQDTSGSPGATALNYSQTINISNTGLSVKNVWLKMHAPVTETLNLTVNANINGGTNRTATYALAGANSIRAGAGDVLYHEFSDDVANISGNSFTIGGSTQYSIATGDAPIGIEAYVTFTWSGSAGGTQTKTVLYGIGQQGVSNVALNYNNYPAYLSLPESVTKTHRSTYLNSYVNHNNTASITATATITLGVNGTTTGYVENPEEGTTATAEGYHREVFHNVTSAVFTGNGGTIGWSDRVFEINANLSVANRGVFSHAFVITYDAAFAVADQPDLTVAAIGTQTTNLGIPSANQFVGGAFTMTRPSGAANVTSIAVTVNDATGLSNMDLYTDTAASCSTADPTTATLFGTTASVTAKTTVTGTASVNGTTRCFYVVLDVGAGAANGQTLEVSIAASGDVAAASSDIVGSFPVAISGTTTLVPPTLDQSAYRVFNGPASTPSNTGNMPLTDYNPGATITPLSNAVSENGSFASGGPNGIVGGTVFGFDFSSLSAGSTVTGIEVKVKGYITDSNKMVDISLSDGMLGSDSYSKVFPASNDWLTYGGAGDTWGRTWTLTEVGSLMVSLASAELNGGYVYVDAITVKVYANSGDFAAVGTPLEGTNTGATLVSAGQNFKLRTTIHVGNNQLPQSGQQFKLRYAVKGASCAASTFADVTASTPIAYYNLAGGSDGAALTADALNDPSHSGHTTVAQSYESLNNFTNAIAAIPAGQDGLWDFSLVDNSAPAGTVYCFKITKTDNSDLTAYTVYPEVTIYQTTSITISGSVYQTNESTKISTIPNIKMAIGTTAVTPVAVSGGDFSFTNVPQPSAGQVITIWVDAGSTAGTNNATLVFKYGTTCAGGTSSCTGLVLYEGNVIIGVDYNNTANSITNADLAACDNDTGAGCGATPETDIGFTSNAGALSLTWATNTLRIKDGNAKFAPGGDITAVKFKQSNGEFTGGSGTINLTHTNAVNLLITGGTFNSTSGVTNVYYGITISGGTFNHSNGSFSFIGGYHKYIDTGSAVFKNIEINACVTCNVYLTNTWNLAGNLTLTLLQSIETGTIAVSGNILTADSSVGGNGTILMEGNGTQTLSASGGTGSLPRLRINKTGGSLTVSDTIELEGLPAYGDLFNYTAGTVSFGTSTLRLGTQDHYSITSNDTLSFNNLEFNVCATCVGTIVGVVEVSGNLNIVSAAQISGGSITVAGNLTSSDSDVYGTTPITLNGTGAQQIDVGSGDLPTGLLTIDKASGTATLTSNLTTPAGLTITRGRLDSGASFDLTVNGAFNIGASGVFTDTGSGDVYLGGDVSNAGNLVVHTGGGSGCSETADDITITSTNTTARTWTGVGTFNLEDVRMSYQIAGVPITVYSGQNITGNSGSWTWALCSITLSGTVYAADETTPLATTPAMKLVVDGATAYSTTALGDGTFTFNSVAVPSDGQVVTVWLNTDAGTDKASLVFVYGDFCTDYPNCSGLNLYKDNVIIGTNYVTPVGTNITNAILAACDNDTGTECADTDIGFTSNAGTLTTTWATNTLRIKDANAKFAPGGAVTVGGFKQSAGSFNGGSGTIYLNSSLLLSGGSFTSTSGTLYVTNDFIKSGSPTFSANGGTFQIGGTGVVCEGASAVDAAGITFNNVIFDKGCFHHVVVTGTMDVNGNFTLTDRGADTNFSQLDTGTVTVGGDLTINKWAAGSGSIKLDGSGIQAVTGTTTGYLPIGFEIASSGTVNLSGTIIVTNNITYTSGTVSAGTSTVQVGLRACEGNSLINTGAAQFNNFVIKKSCFYATTITGNLDVNGDLTIDNAGPASGNPSNVNGGTITLAGNLTNTDGNGGSVGITFDGSNAQTITHTAGNLPSGLLSINKTNPTDTVTLATNVVLGGGLTITEGTLSQGASYNLTANGALTVGASGILSNTGTGDLTLGGNVTNNGTITINGNGGTSCHSDADDIIITSTNTTPRTWSGAGTFSLEDVTMSYQTANVNITLTDSTNAGNNANGTGTWTWSGCGITISGSVYLSNEATKISTTPNIKLMVGTTAATPVAVSTGDFTFTGVSVNAGDVITIWVDAGSTAGTTNATLVFKYGTTCAGGTADCTGLSLYQTKVIIGPDYNNTSNSITNADLAACDNDNGCGNDTDLGFTSNSGTLTLLWSTNVLRIKDADARFAPGGNVNAAKFALSNGSYTGASEILSVSGTGTSSTCTDSTALALCIQSGTFTTSNNTVRFQGSGATIPARSYYSLSLNPSGSAQVLSSGTFTIGGNLTSVGASAQANDPVINIAGNMTISSTSTFAVGTGKLTLEGNLTVDGILNGSDNTDFLVKGNVAGAGAINLSGAAGTFEQRVASAKNFGPTGGSYFWTLPNLKFSNSSGAPVTISAVNGSSGSVTVLGVLTVGETSDTHPTTFSASSETFELSGTGTPLVFNGTSGLTANTSVFKYTNTTSANVAPATYATLTLEAPSGTPVFTMTGDTVVSTALNVTRGTFSQGSSYNLTSGNVTVGINGILSNTGTGDLALGGNVSNSGSIIMNSSNGTQCTDGTDDIVIDSTVDNTLRSWTGTGTFTIYNVDVDDMTGTITAYTSVKSADTTWTLGSCGITISGLVVMEDYVNPLTTQPPVKLAVGGTVSYTTTALADGSFTFTGVTQPADNSILTFWLNTDAGTDKGSTVFIYNSTVCLDYPNCTTGAGLAVIRNSVYLSNAVGPAITNADLAICDNNSGSACSDTDIGFTSELSGTYNLTLSRPTDLLFAYVYEPQGNLTAGGFASAAYFDGGSGTIDIGNLGVMENASFTASSGTMYIANSLSISDEIVFNHNNGTVVFDGDAANKYFNYYSDGSVTLTFNNLTFDSAGSVWAFDEVYAEVEFIINGNLTMNAGTFNTTASNITVNGDLTTSSGTLSGSGDITVIGNVTGNGTVNMSGGTFLVDGDGNFGGSTNWIFNNLTFGDGTGTSTTTGTGGSGYIFINGVMTINTNQTLAAGTNRNYVLQGSGTPLVVTGAFDPGASSTVYYNGATATNVASATYHNLGIGSYDYDTGAGVTYTMAGDVTVNGALTIGSSSSTNIDTLSQGASYNLTTGAVTVTTKGIWSNLGTGDITLSGNVTNAGSIIINANGGGNCAGGNDDIIITSTTTDVRTWSGAGTFLLEDVNMSYMNAAVSITLYSSTGESGQGNTGSWDFDNCVVGILVSGNFYATNETTAIAGAALKLSVAGAANITADAVTDAGGAWSFTGVSPPTPGQVITIWVDGGADRGSLVFKYGTICEGGTADCTGLKLFKDNVIIGVDYNNTANSISNADLSACDNDSGTGCGGTPTAEIGFTSNSGTLTVTFTHGILNILSGVTFTPEGNIEAPIINNAGIFNAGSNTIKVTDLDNYPFVNSGTFNAGQSTFEYAGSGDARLAAVSYYDLLIDPIMSRSLQYEPLPGTSVTHNLTINPSASSSQNFDLLSEANFTVGGAASISKGGSANNVRWITMGSCNTISAGSLSIGSGTSFWHEGCDTVILTGSGNPLVVIGTYQIYTGSILRLTGSSATTIPGRTYGQLEFSASSGSPVYTLGGHIIASKVDVISGTLSQGASYNLTVNGALTVGANGTLSNLGTGDLILGGNVTNNGTITLNGNGGETCNGDTDDILFKSTGTTVRTLGGTGTYTLEDVAISYLNATVPISAKSSTNTAGNTGSWTWSGCGVTITGTVYADEGSTALGSGRTVRIKINGAGDFSGLTNGSGVYSVPGITVASGNVITAFLDGVAEKATTVSIAANASGFNGLDLYQNRLIVRHENTGPITNANLNQFDNACSAGTGDTDVLFCSDGTNMTLSDGFKLIVWTGKTYQPGGTVTTSPSSDTTGSSTDGDVTIELTATLNMAANTLSIGGDFAQSGAFQVSSGQATSFTATASMHNITGGNFENVVFDGTGGVWMIYSPTNLAGDLTITAGTLKSNALITVSGGDVSGNGFFDSIDLTLYGAGNFGGNANWTFNNLTFGDGTGTATTTAMGTGGITVSGVLTIAANQTLNAGSKTWTIAGSGTGSSRPFKNNGTFTASSGTVIYSGSSNTDISAATYNNLTLGGTGTYILPASDVAVRGDMTIVSGSTVTKSASNKIIFAKGGVQTVTDNNVTKQDLGNIQISSNTTDTALYLGSNITLTKLTIDANQTFTQDVDDSCGSSKNLVILGVGVGAARPFINNGTYNPCYGRTDFDAISGTAEVEATTYTKLRFGPNNGGNATYILGTASSQTITVNEYLILNSVTIDSNTYDPNLLISGYIEVYGGTYQPGSGVVTMKGGSGGYIDDQGATKQNWGNVRVSESNGTTATTLALNSNVTMTTLIIDSGETLNLNGSHVLTLTGSGTTTSRPLQNNGTFTASTGTIIYAGTAATTIENIQYNNLTLSPNGAGTPIYTLISGDIRGDLIFGDGNYPLVVDSSVNNAFIEVVGNFTINANVTYNKAASSYIIFSSRSVGNDKTFTDNTASKQDIGKVMIDAAIGTRILTLGSSAKMSYLWITSSDTVNINGYDLTLTSSTNSLVVTGTLNQTGASNLVTAGTVSVDGAGSWTHTGTGTITLGGGVSNAGSININAGGGGNCDNGNDDIVITSTNTTVRSWSGAGTFILADVNISYMNAAVAITVYSGTNGTGNAGSWNWGGCGITISGDVYDVAGVSRLSGTIAMKLAVGGTTSYSANAVNGVFSFGVTQVPANGSVITIWLDTNGVTNQASMVFKYGSACLGGGANCVGLVLYDATVVIDRDYNGGGNISNADMAACDNDSGSACSDTDIGFTSASNNLTLTWTSNTLSPLNYTNYSPGGNINAVNYRMATSIVQAGSGTLTFTGNFTKTSGDFYAGSGTISITGSLTNQAATFNGQSATINVGGNFSTTGGEFLSTSGTLTLGGNVTNGGGTFNPSTGSVKFAPGNKTVTITGDATYNNLEFKGPDNGGHTSTFSVGAVHVVTGMLKVSGAGRAEINGGGFEARGDITLTNSNPATGGTSTVTINGTGNQVLTGSGTSTQGGLPNVVINKASGNLTLSGIITSTRDWTFTSMGTGTLITTGSTVVFWREQSTATITGTHTLNNVIFQGSGNGGLTATYTIVNPLTVKDFTFGGGLGKIELNGSTINVSGNLVFNAAANSGTTAITMTGGTAQSITDGGGTKPSGLFTIDKASGTVTLASAFATGGALTITQGTLSQGASFNLTVNGALTVGALGVLSNTGTGDLILGGNVTNAGAITMNSNNGAQCTNGADDILIRSTVNNTLRSWSGAGTFTIYNVDVDDMTGTITAYTSIKSADTTWTLGSCGTTITVQIYDPAFYDPYDCSANNLTIALKINGAGSSSASCTASNGTIQFTDQNVSANAVLTVYVTAGSVRATTVYKMGSGTSNFSMYMLQSSLYLKEAFDAPAITNADLDVLDSGDESNIVYSVSSNNLTLEDGAQLFIGTVTEYAPGGSVTTSVSTTPTGPDGDIICESAWTLDNNAVYIGGNLNVSSCDISSSAGQTMTFTGTGSDYSIYSTSFNAPNSSLVFEGSGSWTLLSEGTVGSVIVNAGTLNTETGANFTVKGNVIGDGTISMSMGTFTVDGASFGGNSNWTFNNLTFGDATGTATTTATGTGAITVNGVLTVSASQTLSAGSKTWTLAGFGTPFVSTGIFNRDASTFVYAATSATNITAATYHHLHLLPAGTVTYTAAGAIAVTGDFILGNGTNALTFDVSANNPIILVAGDMTINENVTYLKGAAYLEFLNSGTKTLTDNRAIKGDIGAVSVYNTATLNLGSSVTVTSLIIQTDTAFSLNGSNTLTITGSGSSFVLGQTRPFSIVGGGIFDSSTGTVNYVGNSGSTTLQGTVYHNLGVGTLSDTGSGTNYTLGGNTEVKGALTIGNASSVNIDVLNASTYTLTFSGSGNPLNVTARGDFTEDTSTVIFKGTSATTIPGYAERVGYYNLELTPAATVTYSFSNDDVYIRRNITIGDGINRVTVVATSGNMIFRQQAAIDITFTINNNAIFSKSTGQITFEARTGNTVTIIDNTSPKQDLGIVGCSSYTGDAVCSLGSSAKMTSLTVQANTSFTLNGSNTLSLTGSGSPLSVAGTFTPSTGTLEFLPSGAVTVTVPAINYNHLSLNSSSAGPTFTLGSSGSQTISVAGNLVMGNGTNAITVNSSTNNPNLTLYGDFTINQYVTYNKGTGITTFKKGGNAAGVCGDPNRQYFYDRTDGIQDIGNLVVSANGSTRTCAYFQDGVAPWNDLKFTSFKVEAGQKGEASGIVITGSGTDSSRPMQIEGSFSNNGEYITFKGTSATQIDPTNFGMSISLYFAPESGSPVYTVGSQAGQTFTINYDVYVGDGTNPVTLDLDTYDPNLVGIDYLWVDQNATVIKGSGTIRAAQFRDNNAVKQDLGNIIADGTNATLPSLLTDIKATSLTVDTGKNFNFSDKTLTLTGNTPITNNGTIGFDTGTVEFAPSQASGSVTVSNLGYYNLKINKANNTFQPDSSAFTVTNNLEIAAGTLDLGANDPSLTVNGILTIGTGSVLSASDVNALTLKGDFVNNGTFNSNSGTVVFASPTEKGGGLVSIKGSSNTIFHNLSASMPLGVMKVKSGSTQEVTGVLTFQGESGRPIFVESDEPNTQWILNLSGSGTATYIIVKDSGCHGSSNPVASSDSIYNGGNNGVCWGFKVHGSNSSHFRPVDNGDGGGTPTGGGTNQGNDNSQPDIGDITTTPAVPSAVANESVVGSLAWTNPENAMSENGSYATATLSTQPTVYLKATGFGFAVPSDALVKGILVEWRKSKPAGLDAVKDYSVKLVKADSVASADRAKNTNWGTALSYISYGGSHDLWGQTWTPADINNANFGTALSAYIPETSDGAQIRVDNVQITIYYTPGAGGGGTTGGGSQSGGGEASP